MWTGDIYLPTPHAARYFGNVTQYGDLFHFVRRHGELLDATTEAVALPRRSEGRYTLTHSKGPQGGDGKRFRFPFPYTAKDYKGAQIGGTMYRDYELIACQQMCDKDDQVRAAASRLRSSGKSLKEAAVGRTQCKGIYLSDEGHTCYTLRRLVVTGTTLAGRSYTRSTGPTPPPPPGPRPAAVSSEPGIRLKVRRNAAGDSPVLAVHMVDWRKS